MSSDKIIIGNKKYRINKDFPMFGVDRYGNVINILTRETINMNDDGKTIRLRKSVGKSMKIKISNFMWETYRGKKPKGVTIIHINGDKEDNRIDNLKLRNGGKEGKLSIEERKKNDEINKAKWRKKEWICPNCGKVTTNIASGYHRKVCTPDNPDNGINKRKLKEGEIYWINKMFKCGICNKEYKNNYKSVHTALCEKRNGVRQRSH